MNAKEIAEEYVSYLPEWKDKYKISKAYLDLLAKQEGLGDQLNSGRDYLMQVQEDEITVDDALEAFGFGQGGLD